MRLEDKFKQKTGGKYPYITVKSVDVNIKENTVTVVLSAPYESCDALERSGEKQIVNAAFAEIFAEEGVTLQVKVVYKKVYFNAEIIRHVTQGFLSREYAAFSMQIADGAISVEMAEGIPKIVLKLPEFMADAFCTAGIPAAIQDHVFDLYAVRPQVKVEKYAANAVDMDALPKTESVTIKQYFHVTSEESALIGDTILERATYISRVPKTADDICIAGEVRDLEDRVSQKQYHFNTFKLDDGTGVVECIKFSRSKKRGNLGALKNGDTVKVTGGFESESFSAKAPKFIVRSVSFCKLDKSAIDDTDPKKDLSEYPPVPIVSYEDSVYSLQQMAEDIDPSIKGRSFVSLDFETTSLDPASCKVIEVGLARMVDGKVTEYFDTLVDPGVPIPAAASQVNKIYDKDVKNAPPIEAVLPQMMEFIGSDALIAHNGIKYDYIILGRLLKEAGLQYGGKFLDTLNMADELRVPGRHNLSDLCAYFHIPLLNAHRAYADCIATAKLYVELVRFAAGRKNI